MNAGRPLAEVGVLVTRPAAQAAGFAARLRDLGAVPILFPALEIQATARPGVLRAALDALPGCDLAIFISPTAAEWGLRALGRWPTGVAVAAVGNGTARALAERGIAPVLSPADGADSEHLLALPELANVADKHILVFRGEGGRELLADVLRARGARVEYAECYRRGRPDADPAPLVAALAEGHVGAVTAFSGETLDNLLDLLGDAGAARLRNLPLFVPHPRIADRARLLHFSSVYTTGAGESGLIAGLVEYFSHV